MLGPTGRLWPSFGWRFLVSCISSNYFGGAFMSQAATLHMVEESGRLFGPLKGKAAMWIFLISDACTFAMLLAAYGVLRMSDPNWPVPSHTLNIPLTGLNTAILAISSVSMLKAL